MPTVTQSATMQAALDQLSAILAAIFATPNASDSAAIWALGFITPMTLYFASSMVGKLVNFWRR